MHENMRSTLPKVTRVTLVELLGKRAPSPDAMWAELGKADQSELVLGALIRAAEVEKAGLSPRDAGLYMAAWAVAAFTRQISRDADIPALEELLQTAWQAPETIAAAGGALLSDGAAVQPQDAPLDGR